MIRTTFCSLILISAMAGIAAPAYAQQTPDTAKAPAAAQDTTAPAATPPTAAPTTTATPAAPAAKKTSAATETPDVPSADTLKKAREAGYHTKVRRNVVYYCKDVVETGTRFKTESCLNEDQLAQILDRQQAQRDEFTSHTCSGGGCSGK